MKKYINPEFELRQIFTENVCELSAVYTSGNIPQAEPDDDDKIYEKHLPAKAGRCFCLSKVIWI